MHAEGLLTVAGSTHIVDPAEREGGLVASFKSSAAQCRSVPSVFIQHAGENS